MSAIIKSANWKGAEDTARVACQRLRQARIYNGYTIEVAAVLFGYKDGSKTQLSLIENGERFPPMWILLKASQVYSVPMDYLMGLVDEEEASQNDCRQAALTRKLEATLRDNATRISTAMGQVLAQGAPAVSMVRDLIRKAQDHLHALERFTARNPGFEDMPAGGRLQSSAAALLQAADSADHSVQRYDNIGEAAILKEEQRLGLTKPLFEAVSG